MPHRPMPAEHRRAMRLRPGLRRVPAARSGQATGTTETAALIITEANTMAATNETATRWTVSKRMDMFPAP